MIGIDDIGKKLQLRDSKSDDWAPSSDAYSLDFSSSSICEKESSITSNYDKPESDVTQLENQVE